MYPDMYIYEYSILLLYEIFIVYNRTLLICVLYDVQLCGSTKRLKTFKNISSYINLINMYVKSMDFERTKYIL